ncbi:G patch domain and ankyrin repeat-containing 1 [Gossypium arboreum]|uniref:G patch domain and ankyrin repeat-containing 1 n=1 Tax=Gossypium arboreum TaxID=29729 RepID=A0A0B0PNZ2_GOSAR|nr:G patch domain and ankyrin repeat-containing 1 [Gossypium arboreum]
MREYHLPISWAKNSTIVNDATYSEVLYPIHQLSVHYLFELKLLPTSKYTSHIYIVYHPLRIKKSFVLMLKTRHLPN